MSAAMRRRRGAGFERASFSLRRKLIRQLRRVADSEYDGNASRLVESVLEDFLAQRKLDRRGGNQ